MLVILLATCGLGVLCVTAGKMLSLTRRRDDREARHPLVKRLYLVGASLFLGGLSLILTLFGLAVLSNLRE